MLATYCTRLPRFEKSLGILQHLSAKSLTYIILYRFSPKCCHFFVWSGIKVGFPNWKLLEKRLERLAVKSVQALEAQTADQINSAKHHAHPQTRGAQQEKDQQATRTKKQRRRKSKQSWTAAAPREEAALAKTRKQYYCIYWQKIGHLHPRSSPSNASSPLNLQVHL